MEEWQNRLRAQKEQERKNKTESAEILRNYRGSLKEEDELQKKIRLEEQQKKKDAEQYLHSYRPNVDDIEVVASPNKKSAANKYDGPLPPVVGPPLKDDPRTAIAAGAVSSIAANFTGSSVPKGVGTDETKQNGPMQVNGATATATTKPHQNGNTAAAKTDPSRIDLSVYTDIANNSQSTTDSAQDWVQVTSEEAQLMDEFRKIDDDEAHTVRLDVDFSFGLISTKPQPDFERYMHAVEDVVQAALNENGEIREYLSYDPMYAPFVENVQKDGAWECGVSDGCSCLFKLSTHFAFHVTGSLSYLNCDDGFDTHVELFVDSGGRSNVQRLLVRAVVPIFYSSNGINAKKSRSFIIKSLAAALRRGHFLQIAERGWVYAGGGGGGGGVV